jgi:hypothetical protein
VTIDGAMDYNFSVYHTPKYSGVDSTKIYLESNGGNIEVDIQFKNGIITSIYETQPLQLTLFPNPVSSKFFINGNTEIELKEVAIFNLAGKTVFSEKDVNVNEGINITSLQNGVYVVKINTGFQTISKKLVVKK